MNLPPYLIVRPPDGSSGSSKSVEFLCIDPDRLAGSLARELSPIEGVWFRRVPGASEENEIPQKTLLRSEFDRIVKTCHPAQILVSGGADKRTADLVSGLAADLNVQCADYSRTAVGDTASDFSPPSALPVTINRFTDGHELASWLLAREGRGLAGGIAFHGRPDPSETSAAGPGVTSLLDMLAPWLTRKDPSVRFCLCLPSGPDSNFSPLASRLDGLAENGLAMIHWQLSCAAAALPRKLLWQASKMGVWNHVSGLDLFGPGLGNVPNEKTVGGWIANNPNIVHSFEALGPEIQSASPDSVRVPSGILTYGRLPELPGLPFWTQVRSPGLLLGIAARIGKKNLLRLRISPDSGRLFMLGQDLTYRFRKPEEIRPERMAEIVAMVDAGGSVDITHVRKNLARAYLIGYVLDGGVVVGNSSLKHPRQQFIDRIRGITGLDFTGCVERGYTSVRPEYRAMGIGARLLAGLTERAAVKIFSIISEDNLATQTIAIRNRTRKIAVYFSEKTGKDMGVWMPEHMIDDGIASKLKERDR